MEYCLRDVWAVYMFPQIKAGSSKMGAGLIVRAWDPTMLLGDPWSESRLPGFSGEFLGDLWVWGLLSWARVPEVGLESLPNWIWCLQSGSNWVCLFRFVWGLLKYVKFGWHVFRAPKVCLGSPGKFWSTGVFLFSQSKFSVLLSVSILSWTESDGKVCLCLQWVCILWCGLGLPGMVLGP